MTRRAVLVVVMALVAAVVPAIHAVASGPMPSPLGDCQPDPNVRTEQLLKCRYGPLTVSPGTNMIVFGPVSIESPRRDGYITSFSPNLVDAVSGTVPDVHRLHLHHGVWINARKGTTPFFATGEEKTRSIIPEGYGYPTSTSDTWVLNYMIHNLTPNPATVYIRYDLTWKPIPDATLSEPSITPVEPVWLDAVSGRPGGTSKSVYPVYNPTNEGPDVQPDPGAPSGKSHQFTTTFTSSQDVELITVGGHVHPGGIRDELRAQTCNGQPANNKLLFSSDAMLNDPAQSFGSWDYRMTVTEPGWRYAMRQGDEITVTGFYDVAHPWYEAMAIMFAWGRPLSDADTNPPASLCGSPKTTGVTTAPPEFPENNPAPVFGGANAADRTQTNPLVPATPTVAISAFNYYPGGGKASPAGVYPGETVFFVNYDAAASIFHTVTACANPCNGDTGQKYPLAEWTTPNNVGDSGQLGFGPPVLSPASNRDSWSFTVPSDASDGDLYTYFCRIHPDMRGSLEVVK